jgi:hypothetical protein
MRSFAERNDLIAVPERAHRSRDRTGSTSSGLSQMHYEVLRARRNHDATAWMRSAVRGRSRTQTPSAAKTAFAIAAAVGPKAASPTPTAG